MGIRKRHISPGYATAADAIRYLASACDGARRRDGHGYSTDHTAYGHWLAQLTDQHWGPAEHAAALQLVRIYRNQLDRAGYNAGDILRRRRPRKTSKRQLARLQPGWAPDPTGLHDWRWWNGARWTSHTNPST